MNDKYLKLLMYYLNPFAGHRFGHRISQFRNLLSLCGQRLSPNLATMTYWSTTPYAFGNMACKYKLIPTQQNFNYNIPLATKGFDLLRENIEAIISHQEIQFDFQIQLQQDAIQQPIEIASVVWNEKHAPPKTVARLRIPLQNHKEDFFDLVNRLSFNPWAAAEEHRPMGSINRARKKIYDLSFKNRAELEPSPPRKELFKRFPPI